MRSRETQRKVTSGIANGLEQGFRQTLRQRRSKRVAIPGDVFDGNVAASTANRERHNATCLLEGRAWSGWAPVERVEVSVDGGSTWDEAALGEQAGERAWRGWSFNWDAAPGEYEICSRATDGAGNTQPLEALWNLKGFANNEVERLPVVVRA